MCYILNHAKNRFRKKFPCTIPRKSKRSFGNKFSNSMWIFFDRWTDLGGKKNFHNGAGGTYDCIALMAYYTVCKDFSSLAEIEEMEGSLFLPSFRILSKFVNCNKPLFKKLMYMVFKNAKRQCDKWGDYKMHLAPFDKTKPIYYEFTACPVAEFAKRHNLLELCQPFATRIMKAWS